MTGIGLERIPDEPTLADPGRAFNAPESVLDRLRRRREQAQAGQTIDIPVPGYNGELAVRYRPLYESETKKIAESGDRYGDLDGLIAACVSILVKGEDGKLEPLTHNGEPVKFDDHLAALLDIEVNVADPKHGPARQIVLGTFGTAPVPFQAAVLHSMRLANWMAGGEADQEAELLGE